MTTIARASAGLMAVLALTIWAARPEAYPTYSEDRDPESNCRRCHGDFRDDNYISRTDGKNWGNLHDLHRRVMVSSDCLTCHRGFGPLFYPMYMNRSGGGEGLEPIACVGCHGRAEDAGYDSVSAGLGAGLRQHHTNAGVTRCMGCHMDANPANYTPVGEQVAPPYYFTPDDRHPHKPTNACSPFGEENYAGIILGLDNDGDGFYDFLDPDCMPPFGKVDLCHVSPGRSGKAQTLSVNAASAAAHLAHGDALEPCEER